MDWGFGYGESEEEVSCGLAQGNGELFPSFHESPGLFNSGLRDRNENGVHIRTTSKTLDRVKIWGNVRYIPREKWSMVKFDFFGLSR